MVLSSGPFGANPGDRGKLVKPQMAAVLTWSIQMDADALALFGGRHIETAL
jgi:hypothetical protein